jgi:hypothetical protein
MRRRHQHEHQTAQPVEVFLPFHRVTARSWPAVAR